MKIQIGWRGILAIGVLLLAAYLAVTNENVAIAFMESLADVLGTLLPSGS